MIVDELIAILGFDLKGEDDLKRFNDGLDRAENGARQFAGSMAKIGLAVAGAFAAIGGAQAIGRWGGDFIASITQTGREFENFGVRLRALEGSSEAAERAMDWIKQFAIETPLELDEVVNAFANMRSFGLDPTNGSLRAIVDTMAATGGGADKLNGIVLALGQAWTKGKLQGEEAMQLLERGVPVWELLSEATGKTAAELQELSSKGKLGRETIQLLIDALGSKYLGASEEAAKTFDGILSNLSDNWKNFLLTISDAGYYDDVKRRLQSLLEWVNGLWSSGFAQRLARNVSRGLVGAMNTASHLATQAYRIGRGFFYAADGVLDLIGRVTGLSKSMAAAGLGLGLLASSAFGRAAIIAIARRVPLIAALFVLEDLISGLNGDQSVIGSLEGGEEALAGIRAEFEGLYTAAQELADTLNGVFFVQRGEGETPIQAMMRSLSGFAAREAVQFLQDLAGVIREVSAALQTISAFLQDPEAAFKAFADAAIAQIDRIVVAIDQALGGALTRFGFIGSEPVAQDPGVRVGGGASRSRAPVANFEPDAGLVRDGMVQAEGMRAEYGVGEDRMIGAAQGVAGFLSKMKTAASINGAIDALRNFMEPATQARRAMDDLERGVMAKIDADITPLTTKIAAAKAAIEGLRTATASLGASPRGLSVPPARIATGAAQP